MTRRIVTSPFAEDGPPSTPAGPPPPVPVLAHLVVLAAAVGTSLFHVATAVLVTVRRAELQAWVVSTSSTDATVELANLFVSLAAPCTFVAFVATGVWLTRLRPVAQWVAPGRPHRRSPVWALLGWIVPIVSLWFPYQVVADTSRALGSRVRTFWPWWIAWLVLTSVTVTDRSGGELASVGDVHSWMRMHQTMAVVSVVACVLWWRIVRSATTAAETATAGG